MRRGAASVVAAVCTAAGGANQFAPAADRTFNVSLVGQLNPLAGAGSTNNLYADLWAEGNLVVLGSVGAGSGVSIINNANPAAPTLHTRYMPAGNENGQFRDVVLRNNIGYFAIDSATTGTSTLGGVHIVDLSNPAAPVRKSVIRDPVGFFNNHDLFLDGNYLYIASNRTHEMKVFNVANPAAPAHVRNIITAGIATDDLHDMTIKNGRMYTSNITNGITQIYDVSNMSTTVAPTLLGQLDVGTRNHSVWPSEDGHLLAVAREDNGGEVQLWNIQNPASPALVRSIHAADFGIDSFSAHNPIIVGDTLYVSWYQAGLQIFNIRDPQSPTHLGAYDTWAGGNGGPTAPGSFAGGYDGNWGLDVSGGKSRIVLSDFDNGFFTVDATNAFRKVWTNAGNASWQDNARWSGGAGPFPNSSEMTASFTHAAAGATRTVTVDSTLAPATPRVAGIEFVSSLSYTIQPAAGGAIEMVSSDGPARITLLDGGVGAAGVNRILAPIALDDDLLVTNNAFVNAPVAPLELNVINATNRTITFAGTGETALVAANPGFTGSAVLSSGKLTLRHAQALNAQPITASGGVLVLRNNASANYGSDLTVTGGGIVSLSLGNGGAGAGQAHALDDITVAAGATLRLFRNDATTLSAGDVAAAGVIDVMPQPGGGTRATRVAALDIPLGGRVNLGDTSLIVTDTPLAVVEQLVTRAYNFMSWDGSGIATAQPQALQSITTLAVATAGEVFRESFGGFSVSADDVLVMYTYTGDVNFDGLIDGSDYGIIDNYVQFPGTTGYVNGDFNYDGTIDGADYGLIDNAIQLQGDPFPIGSVSAAAPMTASAVPEPSIVSGVSALTLATALRGRRSRRRVIRAN